MQYAKRRMPVRRRDGLAELAEQVGGALPLHAMPAGALRGVRDLGRHARGRCRDRRSTIPPSLARLDARRRRTRILRTLRQHAVLPFRALAWRTARGARAVSTPRSIARRRSMPSGIRTCRGPAWTPSTASSGSPIRPRRQAEPTLSLVGCRQPVGGMPLHDLHAIDLLLLAGAVLILVGIASSLLARRFGAPLLLVFLLLGLLLGEDGPVGIRYDDTRADLSGRRARTGGDPVRWRAADARGAGARQRRAGAGAGDRRRRAHRGPDRRGRGEAARTCRRWKRCCSARSSRRPMRRRCSSCCAPADCTSSGAAARRWRSSRAPTIRPRCS